MTSIFLLGGGEAPEGRSDTYGRFVQAATTANGCRMLLIIAEEQPSDFEETFAAYRGIFESVGAAHGSLTGLYVSPEQPLTPAALVAHQPTGVFVCGGLTPLYQAALCVDRAWLGQLQAAGIPYGGVSAGAAIAATRAIVGGWRTQRGDRVRAILYQGFSEDRDLLDVRDGLGLVPFSIDVHASQWSTLMRLLHAVDLGLVAEGWAIDEDTLLQIEDDALTVHGLGHAYHVRRNERGEPVLTIYTAGQRLEIGMPRSISNL